MSILGDPYDEAIRKSEGFSSRPQWDYKQWSNGYGTRASGPGDVVDEAEAKRRYDAEIDKAHGVVTGFMPGLDPGSQAALTSLTYNSGDAWTRSGLGAAVKNGDWDKARASFLQYNKADGATLPGLQSRRGSEVGWLNNAVAPNGELPRLDLINPDGSNARGAAYASGGKPSMADYQWNEPNPWEMAGTGGQTAPEDDAWRRRMPAPMAGGMQPPAPTPMASPQARPDQPRQPSLMEQIVGRTQNPLFQQGLGLFLAASQGKDLNEGLNAGSTRAAAMQDVMMKNLALQKQTEQAAKIKEMMNNPAIMGQVPPALIEIARATGDPSPIIQHLTKAGGTDDTKEFEYAKKAGFEGSFTDWMKSKKNMQGEYAKQLVYGTNDAGDVVPMQAGSRGDLVQSKLPGGVKLQRDPIKVDLGDRWGFMDPTTRTIVNMVPKNLAEAESQKQQGEARGKAKASLPMVESAANNIITKVESVLNDPQLDKMVGYSGYIPNMSPEARGFMAKVKQLEGTAFLQAFESLKGAGAITETEGAQAKAALIRFQEMVQTGADYRLALRDYIDQVRRITDVARQRASGDQSPAAMPQSAQPAPDNRKRYKYNPQTGELE